MAQGGFVQLLAIGGFVATRFAAMQSVLIARFEFRATNRAVLLINLPREVLVLVTTSLAPKDAAQHGQRCPTMFTLSTTASF